MLEYFGLSFVGRFVLFRSVRYHGNNGSVWTHHNTMHTIATTAPFTTKPRHAVNPLSLIKGLSAVLGNHFAHA